MTNQPDPVMQDLARRDLSSLGPGRMVLAGPINERALRELRERNEQKRAEALQFLGDRWILHPKNKVR